MTSPRPDLEQRFEERLHDQLDAAVGPFSAASITARAMEGGRTRVSSRPALTLATLLVVVMLIVVALGTIALLGNLGGGLSIRVAQTVDLGGGDARAMAAGEGSLWIARRGRGNDGTATELLRVDAARGAITAIPLSGAAPSPISVAYGFGSVWVLDEYRGLVRVDPDSGEAIATIPIAGMLRDCHVAVGPDAVWVSSRDAMVDRVDPATNTVAATIDVTSSASGLLATDDAVWVDGAGELIRILPRANAQLGSVGMTVQDDLAAGLAQAGNGVWVGSGLSGAVVNVSSDLEVVRSVSTHSHPLSLAASGGWLWVGESDGTVELVDPQDGSIRARVVLGKYIRTLAAVSGSVWALSEQEGVLYRLEATSTPATMTPSPAASSSIDPADAPIGWPLLPEDPELTAAARELCLPEAGADVNMPFAYQERREPDWATVIFADTQQIATCTVRRMPDGTMALGDPYGSGGAGLTPREPAAASDRLTIIGAGDATNASPLYWSSITGLVPEGTASVRLIAGGKAAEGIVFDGTYTVSWQGMVKPSVLVAYDVDGNEIDRLEGTDLGFKTRSCDPNAVGGC